MNPEATAESSGQKERRRRWPWIFGFLLLGTLCVMPEVVARTGLRDRILFSLVGEEEFSVRSSGASFGWLSPLSIDELSIRSPDGDVDISIARLEAEQSWWQLWIGGDDLGRLLIDRPQVKLILDEQESEPIQLETLPILTADIQSGSLLVRQSQSEEPVVDASDLSLTLHVQREDGHPVAVVDAITLADHEPLSREASEHGLQLIAPVLVDEVQLTGEYTLRINEARLPLDGDEPERRASISGELVLHDLAAEFTNDVTRRVILVMAELMEIEDVPEQIRLLEDATVSFTLKNERVQHEATAALLPNLIPGITVSTAGDVGLDESLNVRLAVKVPFDTDHPTPLAEELSRIPIEVLVTGTAEKPQWEIPSNQMFLTRLRDAIGDAELSDEEKLWAEGVRQAIGELTADLGD